MIIEIGMHSIGTNGSGGPTTLLLVIAVEMSGHYALMVTIPLGW